MGSGEPVGGFGANETTVLSAQLSGTVLCQWTRLSVCLWV